MKNVQKWFDGKKTYFGILVTALLGLFGLSDEVATGSPEAYAQLIGLAVAAGFTAYGRWAIKPKAKAKKRKAKKVVKS